MTANPSNAAPGRSAVLAIALLVIIAAADSAARADTFVFRDREGTRHEVEARLAGSGQRAHALELSDGQILVVPEASVSERRPGDDPKPIDHLAMEKKLVETFPADTLLTAIERPMVLAMVLARPVEQPRERAQRVAVLRKFGKYFGNVQGKFLEFIRATRVPIQGVRFPLVVLIFESDGDFDDYAAAVIGGDTLSARNIAGFYSAMSNHLVLRLSECDTFQVPMHEFIHMQVHNRGIFERLSPVPVWFHEGIATSFEGERGQVRRVPTNITESYAKLAARARTVTWKQIIEGDRPFQGDLFAGEAYGNAWGMHWLLLTQYKVQYGQYVRKLAEKKALEEYSAADRLEDFEEIFEKSPDDLQREFLERIARAGIRVSANDRPATLPAKDRSSHGDERSFPASFAAPREPSGTSPETGARRVRTAPDLAIPWETRVRRLFAPRHASENH